MLAHPLKALPSLSPILFNSIQSLKSIAVILSQFVKQPLAMLTTLDGIIIFPLGFSPS